MRLIDQGQESGPIESVGCCEAFEGKSGRKDNRSRRRFALGGATPIPPGFGLRLSFLPLLNCDAL
jgi:hypothetical protein